MCDGEKLTCIERNQLLAQVVSLLPGRSLLPPPTIIRLRVRRHGMRNGFDVAVVSCPRRHSESEEFCEVTGCLDHDLTPDRSIDVTQFRDWAISAPAHPLAIRYQPLCAWLRAANCDARFLALADRFIEEERFRLRCLAIAAAERLLSRGSNLRRRRA